MIGCFANDVNKHSNVSLNVVATECLSRGPQDIHITLDSSRVPNWCVTGWNVIAFEGENAANVFFAAPDLV